METKKVARSLPVGDEDRAYPVLRILPFVTLTTSSAEWDHIAAA